MEDAVSAIATVSSETVLPVLECGASLAEDEHYDASSKDRDGMIQDHNRRQSSSIDVSNGGTETESEIITSTNSLRERLALDVVIARTAASTTTAAGVGNGGCPPYTLFASPFRRDAECDKLQQQAQKQSLLYRLPLVYCDQTASNRPVQSIERYLEKVCLPLYGNTHTNTSITGSQR
jgi:hypothetical protein